MRTLAVISLIWLRYGSFACQGDPADILGQVIQGSKYPPPTATDENDMDYAGNGQPVIKVVRLSSGAAPQVYDLTGRGGGWGPTALRTPSIFGSSGMDSEYGSSPLYPSNRARSFSGFGGMDDDYADPFSRRPNSRRYSSFGDDSELIEMTRRLQKQTQLLKEAMSRFDPGPSYEQGRYDQPSETGARVNPQSDLYESETGPNGRGQDYPPRASPTAGGRDSTRWPASQPPPRTQSLSDKGGYKDDRNRGDWEAVDSYSRNGRGNNGETSPTGNMDYPRRQDTGIQDSYGQRNPQQSSGGWPPRQSNMRPAYDGGMRTASFDGSRSPPYASRGYGSSYGGDGTVTNPSVAQSATQTRPTAGLDNFGQDNRFANRGGGNIVARDPVQVPPPAQNPSAMPSPARVSPRAPSPTPVADQKDVTSANPGTSPTPQGALPTSIVLPMIHDEGSTYAVFTVGTAKPGQPDQKLKALIDTGSSRLWLLTTESCARQQCYRKVVPFDKTKSDSYQPDGRSSESNYGKGRIVGTLARETITIGDLPNKVSVTNVKIGEAQAWQNALTDYDILCGMNVDMEEGSLLSQMVKQYGRALPFGLYYNKFYPDKSQMIFGQGYQPFIEWNNLNSHPVQPTTQFGSTPSLEGWHIRVTGLGIEVPNQQPLIIDKPILALTDTGASGISGPPDIMNQINNELFRYFPGQYNSDYSFSCQVNWQQLYVAMPDALIYIDGKKYNLLPYEYLGSHSGRCMSYFRPTNGISTIKLGRVFTKRYFVRFDPNEKLVQFALAKQEAHQMSYMFDQIEAYRWDRN